MNTFKDKNIKHDISTEYKGATWKSKSEFSY